MDETSSGAEQQSEPPEERPEEPMEGEGNEGGQNDDTAQVSPTNHESPTAHASPINSQTLEKISSLIDQVRHQVRSVVIGQDEVVDDLIVALLSNGHVLIEGVPGLGKTLLVRTLAKCFGGQSRRIQFTPDLMPSDVVGHVLFDVQASVFRVRKGPVFTNLLLADEINRAPAKTQSALLEAMQERQVTLEAQTHMLPAPFVVIATQNPLEHEGTYPLPEAELDRFMMKLQMEYPSHEDEVLLTMQMTQSQNHKPKGLEEIQALLSTSAVVVLQSQVLKVIADQQVVDYAVRLVGATRQHPGLIRGAGTRACLALVQAARATALIQGQTYITPDHIKARFFPIMRHRVLLTADMEIDGFSPDDVLRQVLQQVEAPRA